jgi:methyl-accepting chemotaxis protein
MTFAATRGVGLRLALAFGLLVGLLLLVAALGIARLDALNREFSMIVVDRHSRTEVLKEITDSQLLMMRLVNHLLVVESKAQVDADLGRIDAAKHTVGERLEQLDRASSADDARGKALLRAAHERTSLYLVNLVRFTRLVSAGRRDEARALLAQQLEEQLDASYAAMADLSHAQTALMHRAQQEAQLSYEEARLQILAISLASAALALAVAIAIARGITRPLARAVEVAGAVAAGDLTSRIVARGGDETAHLMQALGRMNESLTELVGAVRSSSGSIAGTARELVVANSQLTQRAEEQASSLEETAATLEQLTATVRGNADHAGEASRLAKSASEVAARGGQAMGRAVARMGTVTSAARRIADITHVINGLASQTNLLALNAAVEAARAGDQGRGFAVVAAEVRSLAHRSAGAAREIGQLIADTVDEVEDGARLVNEAGQTMEEVVAGIRGVSSLIGDISGASREQSEAIEQVNQALAQIDEVTQHNVALAEESAAAVESLEQQADALVKSVSVFRLASDDSASPAPEAASALPGRAAEMKKGRQVPAPCHALRLAPTAAAR